jgi:hypothetical protein
MVRLAFQPGVRVLVDETRELLRMDEAVLARTLLMGVFLLDHLVIVQPRAPLHSRGLQCVDDDISKFALSHEMPP